MSNYKSEGNLIHVDFSGGKVDPDLRPVFMSPEDYHERRCLKKEVEILQNYQNRMFKQHLIDLKLTAVWAGLLGIVVGACAISFALDLQEKGVIPPPEIEANI